jgi:hypothetical protein
VFNDRVGGIDRREEIADACAIFIEDTAALKNAPDLQILVRASPERSS